MSGLHVDSQGAELTVSNNSSTRAHDVLTFDLVVNGQRRFFWTSINLGARSSALVTVRFLKDVQAPVIGLCGNPPLGIVEGSEPILQVTW